jgi:hypothetical protein
MGLDHAYFAGFPAIRAIVFAVHAQPNAVLPLAIAAIAIACAFAFRLVALGTMNGTLHYLPSSKRKTAKEPHANSMKTTIGYPTAQEQDVCAL